jgi:hypothetical protein
MKVTTFIVEDEEDPEESKVHYAVILQEEEYEDEDVPGFTTHEYAPAGWQTRVDVQPWDPSESNFFRIQ